MYGLSKSLTTSEKPMTSTTDTLAKLARSLADAFVQKKRDTENEYGDKSFWSLKSKAPHWMTEAVRKAHDDGDILPNDWIYQACSHIADSMADTDPDQWDDSTHEWADGLVDVYNNDRTRWLASNLAFGAIVDDAVKELGRSDQGIFGDIGIGQYVLLCNIASALVSAVREQAEA